MSIYTVSVINTTTNRPELVEVTEEVYTAFRRTGWILKNSDRSYMRFNTNFSELPDNFEEYFESKSDFVEVCDSNFRESISQIEMHLILTKALQTLRDKDKKLIQALFYEGYTEKAYADKLGVSQPVIHRRKARILEKLKKEIEKTSR